MTPVIKIENVSKLYKLGFYGADTFRDEVLNFFARLRGKPAVNSIVGAANNLSDKDSDTDLVWALKDINLTVNQGDIVGIIGKNGAGKSTLLKILSKITTPTTGSIKIRGRIASLLEVGTGMHQELTGRENIFLNGAILGMTKQEISKKLDEIIDFSGCERYIDTPVKRYSSGMMVRLGFAVAAHLDPEILVVDEVLAVGDAEFQKKAIGKMQDVSKGEGRTVLFVSHNMAAVRNLCINGIVLKDGKIEYTGTANDCIDHYLKSMTTHNAVNINDRTDREGNGVYRVTAFRVDGLSGANTLNDDIPLALEIDLSSSEKLTNLRIGISINTMQNDCALWLDSNSVVGKNLILDKTSTIRIELSQEFALSAGEYFINIACFDNDNKMADYVQHAIEFKVIQSTFCKTGFYPLGRGMCLVNQKWTIL